MIDSLYFFLSFLPEENVATSCPRSGYLRFWGIREGTLKEHRPFTLMRKCNTPVNGVQENPTHKKFSPLDLSKGAFGHR